MEKKGMNIKITGEEKNKNEIIYNNVVDAMDNLKMTKDEQIEYLKTKVSNMENTYQSNIMILITLIISILLLGLGLYLVATDQILLGIVLVLLGFSVIVVKLLLTLKRYTSMRTKKYIEIDSLKENLSSILK